MPIAILITVSALAESLQRRQIAAAPGGTTMGQHLSKLSIGVVAEPVLEPLRVHLTNAQEFAARQLNRRGNLALHVEPIGHLAPIHPAGLRYHHRLLKVLVCRIGLMELVEAPAAQPLGRAQVHRAGVPDAERQIERHELAGIQPLGHCHTLGTAEEVVQTRLGSQAVGVVVVDIVLVGRRNRDHHGHSTRWLLLHVQETVVVDQRRNRGVVVAERVVAGLVRAQPEHLAQQHVHVAAVLHPDADVADGTFFDRHVIERVDEELGFGRDHHGRSGALQQLPHRESAVRASAQASGPVVVEVHQSIRRHRFAVEPSEVIAARSVVGGE